MVQVPSQVLNNLGINLSAPTPEAPSYGMEEQYTRRREDEYNENNYGNEESYNNDRQTMYGDESRQYREESYEEDYDDRNYNEFSPNPDRYDREYHQNIKMSDMGFSPDIIGDSDIIDYDNPYSNNSFEDREIVGYGVPDFWSLENQFGNLKGSQKGYDPFGFEGKQVGLASSEDLFGFNGVGKGYAKDSAKDLFGFSGENRMMPASGDDLFGFGGGKSFASASADDLFGFSKVNPKGMYGGNNFDPQTMFGVREVFNNAKEKVEGWFNKKKDKNEIPEGNDAPTNPDDYMPFDETTTEEKTTQEESSNEKTAEERIQEVIDKANEQQRRAKENAQNSDDSEIPDSKPINPKNYMKIDDDGNQVVDEKEKKENIFKKAFDKIRQQSTDYRSGEKATSPEDVIKAIKGGSGGSLIGLGGGGVSAKSGNLEIGLKPQSASDLFGGAASGEYKPVDYIGLDKFTGEEERDVIGMNNLGEQDVFGFNKYGSNEMQTSEELFGYSGGGTPQTGEDLFGFVGTSNGRPQTSEELFGSGIALKSGNQAPLTFRETFGFSLGNEEPPVVQQHEIRANLVSGQQGQQQPQRVRIVNPPNNVYNKNRNKRYNRMPIQYNQRVPDTTMMAQAQGEPQTQHGLYNRVGRILDNNADYASNFSGYAYNLDVGDMIGWKVEESKENIVGFNPDVIFGSGDFVTPKSENKIPTQKRYRVTSITVPKKVTSKKASVKNSTRTKRKRSVSKKKSTKSNVKGKVKYTKKNQDNGVDLNKLIWG